MLYFDNAATSGFKPASVVKAVSTALEKYSANPGRSGHILSVNTAEKIFKCREKIADFFGYSHPENVIFTLNCTHSINSVVKGVVKRGDHIIISDLEHNSVLRPLENLKRKGIITFDTAHVSLEDNDITVQNFKDCIKKETSMIICTHASNVTGRILPIKEIGMLCKEHGILFAVDAAQSAGVLDINMTHQCIDYLCVAPHKGLFAPMGIGVLIADKHIENVLIEGGTGSVSTSPFQPAFLPDRLESGTINVPGIFGVCAGVDFVKSKGVSTIYNHELHLLQNLYSGLEANKNIELYTPFPKYGEYAPVLSFNFKGAESNTVASALNDYKIAVRGGFHCAPLAHNAIKTSQCGTVRISLGVFNNNKNINYLLNVLKNENFVKKIR